MRRPRWVRFWALGTLSLRDVRDIIMMVALLASHRGGPYARCVLECALRCETLMLRLQCVELSCDRLPVWQSTS